MPEGQSLNIALDNFELTSLWVILGLSVVALLFAAYLVRQVLANDQGTPRMQEIAKAIQEGAAAYLGRQFRTLIIFVGVLTFVLLGLPAETMTLRIARSAAFIAGAAFSAITG
ncbi:MAG: sodium/proton-translocating pyrophosphatase, partial [Actinomycetota bacterium]